jgi:hypothetical protein
MATKTLTPSERLAQAEAARAAAEQAAAEARALVEAEQAEAQARRDEALDEQARQTLAVSDDVERALLDGQRIAVQARDAALSALDLPGAITAEATYHGHIAAVNVWRGLHNSARHRLITRGHLDDYSAPSEKPEKRERIVSLFGTGKGVDEGLIGKAIHARALSVAHDLVVAVLDTISLAHLAEEV